VDVAAAVFRVIVTAVVVLASGPLPGKAATADGAAQAIPTLAIGGIVPSDDDLFFLTSPADPLNVDAIADSSFGNLESIEIPGGYLSSDVGLSTGDGRHGESAVLGSPADYAAKPMACFSSERFWEQSLSAKYELAGIFTAISVIGVVNWNWGSSGFQFHNEGWFGETTASGGMDKLGHAFTGYVITDILTHAIRQNSSDARGGEMTAALLSCSLMTYVELFDGFSGDHGFSYEDLTVDVLGAGFSVLRNTVPGLREKIDFRMQYLPSEYSSFEPFGDYAGQKYFVVLKLAGFEQLRESPLRFVELHGGYCARGFSPEEHRAGADRERNFYVGIGVNLQGLLFGKQNPYRDHRASRIARMGLEYVQVPYTYASTGGNSGR
jgi:hypothetical protein